MKFIAIAALAATALAIPNPPGHGGTAIDQEQSNTVQSCGKAQLNCCSSQDKTTEVSPDAGNALLDLLGNKALDGLLANYKGCSPRSFHPSIM